MNYEDEALLSRIITRLLGPLGVYLGQEQGSDGAVLHRVRWADGSEEATAGKAILERIQQTKDSQ